jgi:hypothetical protein
MSKSNVPLLHNFVRGQILAPIFLSAADQGTSSIHVALDSDLGHYDHFVFGFDGLESADMHSSRQVLELKYVVT